MPALREQQYSLYTYYLGCGHVEWEWLQYHNIMKKTFIWMPFPVKSTIKKAYAELNTGNVHT